MKNSLLQRAAQFYQNRRRKQLWYRAVSGMACVVVFCTVYALILPAITLEKEPVCGLEEHSHTEECYTTETVWPSTEYLCAEELAGFVTVHTHDRTCYDRNGDLVCPLPQIREHAHDRNCYLNTTVLSCELEETGHIHDKSCFTKIRGDLCCGLEECEGHTHGSGCYETERTLICTMEEGEDHTHDEACYETRNILTCEREEAKGHTHTDACYQWTEVLSCGREEDLEGHIHDDSCYTAVTTLICDKEEIVPHVHDASCYDGDGNQICGKPQVLKHQHDETCAVELEGEPEEVRVLACTLKEHTHTDACYADEEIVDDETGEQGYICGLKAHIHDETCYDADDQLTCGLVEHIHDENCVEKLPEIEVPENVVPEGPVYICGLEEHTHNEACYAADGALTCTLEEHIHDENCVAAKEVPPLQELKDDGAFVQRIRVRTGEILSGNTDLCPMTIRNQEVIGYDFLIKMESYTEEEFGAGRVKLEFVLPLTPAEAGFKLSAMSWMDDSAGYKPFIREENRLIGEEERACQVLTAYKLLEASENSGEAVIPGEFTDTVVVSVYDMEPDDVITLQISAAMEYSTWDGCCEIHHAEEQLSAFSGELRVTASVSEEELQTAYENFAAELETLESSGKTTSGLYADDLLQRVQTAYHQGLLRTADYEELCSRASALLEVDVNSIAEAAEGTNWMSLRDSGWFEEYSDYDGGSTFRMLKASRRSLAAGSAALALTAPPPSAVQITNPGGSKTSADGAVTVSKTIAGTDLENVFDITLQVQTSTNVAEIREEPDMAVVIVMDISNTMNSNFGGVTRYAAAMNAAEDFLDQFAANNALGISKVGYVAFNTNAHQIFGLQACSTQEQANVLKNTMRTQTGSIINASGYNASHSRFTNVEAGLAMASDMLNKVSNQNKYIIFLSDGFPTTYISSGYSGYDPYDSTGRFYDHVLNKKCLYGTSYSDEAAIRARNKAVAIKNSGTTIFSIGVDVAGQTIQQYITQSENANGFSVVDRTGTTYEIGDASSTEAYKNWLRNSIGSGYYYDSTDSAGLSNAYNQIFAEIKHTVEAGSEADWVASDPIPTVGGIAETVEFIGLYSKEPTLTGSSLTGRHGVNAENTASFDERSNAIKWDLKNSGYTVDSVSGTTTYTYQLVYRVRLKNETGGFTEGDVYPTNDTTSLQYRTIEGTDGNLTVSDPKTVEFPIPSVQGYLGQLQFQKVDSRGQPLGGAEFTLSHDTLHCSYCRGDGQTSVTVAEQTATSVADGTVLFTNIPSGHQYTLKESKVPEGYSANGDLYRVVVAYDQTTVIVSSYDGEEKTWDDRIVNNAYYALPQTGGTGTHWYTLGGLCLMAGALLLLYRTKTRGKGGKEYPC